MAKARGLGKGLSSLIPTVEAEIEEIAQSVDASQIPLNELVPNPYQPRRDMSDEALESLAASVKEHGIIQPILVRKKDGKYEIIAGERRWRAARMAKLTEVPVRVLDISESQAMELALVENLQREDLGAMDIAQGINELVKRFSLTHDEVAQKLGWSRAAVTNKLRLLQLPEDVQKLMADLELTEGHGRTLLSLPTIEAMSEVGKLAAQKGLNVRQTEEAVRGYTLAHPVLKIKERTIYALPQDVVALCKEKKISVKVASDRSGLALSIKGLHKWQVQVLLEYIGKSKEELFPEE